MGRFKRLKVAAVLMIGVPALLGLGAGTAAAAENKFFNTRVAITNVTANTIQGTVSSPQAPARCAANRRVEVRVNGAQQAAPRTDGRGRWSANVTTQAGDRIVAVARRVETQAPGKPKRVCRAGRSSEFVVSAIGTKNLAVAVAGDGVVTSQPPGINCRKNSGDCFEPFAEGSDVVLTANADPGQSHENWGGACQAVAAGQTCTVSMFDDRVVTATFTGPSTSNLAVAVAGLGNVQSAPDGIDNCRREQVGDSCQATFAENSNVTLTATADGGQQFLGWGGACQGAGNNSQCVLNMSQDRAVTAVFSEPAPPATTHRLTVGAGENGRVDSNPAGINNCRSTNGGDNCRADYNAGTQVTLTANPDANYQVQGWGGSCAGASGNQCTVTMDQNRAATVSFELTCGVPTSIITPIREVLCLVVDVVDAIL